MNKLKKIAIGVTIAGFLLTNVGGVFASNSPNGTGQPSQSCQEQTSSPNGFNTQGFAQAESVYAGSPGTPSLANGNSRAVSQYDVACYQVSQ